MDQEQNTAASPEPEMTNPSKPVPLLPAGEAPQEQSQDLADYCGGPGSSGCNHRTDCFTDVNWIGKCR